MEKESDLPKVSQGGKRPAATLRSVQEVLRFDLDLLGIRAQRGRRREHSRPSCSSARVWFARHAYGQLAPSPRRSPTRLPTCRDSSPTPTRNRKGLPLPVSANPHPFLLVFSCLLQKGNLDGPEKWRLEQSHSVARAPLPSSFSRFAGQSRPSSAPLPAPWAPHPTARPPLPRRHLPDAHPSPPCAAPAPHPPPSATAEDPQAALTLRLPRFPRPPHSPGLPLLVLRAARILAARAPPQLSSPRRPGAPVP